MGPVRPTTWIQLDFLRFCGGKGLSGVEDRFCGGKGLSGVEDLQRRPSHIEPM